MVDPRYEHPNYRGPELNGLSENEAFDLAKQFRIAARNQRIGRRLAAERASREYRAAWWGIVTGVVVILLGLTLAVWAVEVLQ